MSDDLFHLFGKFGIGHLLSRLSLEKQDGFLASQATCSLVHSSTYHVTLSFIYPVYKQLVDLSTRWLVHLPCYSVFYLPYLQATGWLVYSLTCPLTMLLCLLFTLSTSNLFTRPLVDLSTYHVTLSFIYPVYKQLVNLSTRWLVHLPCYSVFYLPYLQATCSLVHSLTCPLTMLPIEVSKSHDKDKSWNVDPQNLFLTKRLSKFALGTWLCQI